MFTSLWKHIEVKSFSSLQFIQSWKKLEVILCENKVMVTFRLPEKTSQLYLLLSFSVYQHCSQISTVALSHLIHSMVTDFIVPGSNRPDNMIVLRPFILSTYGTKPRNINTTTQILNFRENKNTPMFPNPSDFQALNLRWRCWFSIKLILIWHMSNAPFS